MIFLHLNHKRILTILMYYLYAGGYGMDVKTHSIGKYKQEKFIELWLCHTILDTRYGRILYEQGLLSKI